MQTTVTPKPTTINYADLCNVLQQLQQIDIYQDNIGKDYDHAIIDARKALKQLKKFH